MGQICKLLFFLALAAIAVLEIYFLTYNADLAVKVYNASYHDAMHMAVQLGRLDIVSALLGLIGILLAVFGVLGFGYIKSKAEQEARNAAEQYVKDESPKIIREWLDKNGVDHLNVELNMRKGLKEVSKDAANEIVSGGDLDDENNNGGGK